MSASLGILSPEQDVDAGEHQLQVAPRQLADALGELPSIDGDDEGNIRDGVLWKVRRLGRQEHIAGCVGPLEVTRERHADDGAYPTLIQRIALHDDDGPTISRAGSSGFS